MHLVTQLIFVTSNTFFWGGGRTWWTKSLGLICKKPYYGGRNGKTYANSLVLQLHRSWVCKNAAIASGGSSRKVCKEKLPHLCYEWVWRKRIKPKDSFQPWLWYNIINSPVENPSCGWLLKSGNVHFHVAIKETIFLERQAFELWLEKAQN